MTCKIHFLLLTRDGLITGRTCMSLEDAAMLHRRRFLHLLGGVAALPLVPHVARADIYPSRPVRIIVGFAAGGNFDLVARVIGERMSERLGQPVIVENRPGASSNIAAEAAIRAPADGYTLCLAGAVNAINATLYQRLSFNFPSDVAAVAGAVQFPNVMTVSASFPAKSVPEFVAYAKSNPGKINHGSSGNGTSQHLAGELFKTAAGVSFVHVPYRGASQALTDMLGGQVQVLFEPLPASIQHIKSGQLRALAVTTPARSQALPDTPAMSEFLPGYEASGWSGFCVPRNTPAPVIETLNAAINESLADPKVKARFADLGAMTLVGSPNDFGKLIARETEKWAQVIRGASIKVE
jgi:tripartite-type tricarboxylate transporter receptor subunit TctC